MWHDRGRMAKSARSVSTTRDQPLKVYYSDSRREGRISSQQQKHNSCRAHCCHQSGLCEDLSTRFCLFLLHRHHISANEQAWTFQRSVASRDMIREWPGVLELPLRAIVEHSTALEGMCARRRRRDHSFVAIELRPSLRTVAVMWLIARSYCGELVVPSTAFMEDCRQSRSLCRGALKHTTKEHSGSRLVTAATFDR